MSNWPLSDDFEGHADGEPVTITNSIFTGIGYTLDDPTWANSIYTTERAHSGSVSIIGKPGRYPSMELAYDGYVVTAEEDFFVWVNATNHGVNGQVVYDLGMGPEGQLKEWCGGYGQVDIVKGAEGHTRYRFWMQYWPAETQSIAAEFEVPDDTWIKLCVHVNDDGSYQFWAEDVEGFVLDGASGSGWVRDYRFAYHDLHPTSLDSGGQPLARIYFDDVNAVAEVPVIVGRQDRVRRRFVGSGLPW
jgi:hypothetical protein